MSTLYPILLRAALQGAVLFLGFLSAFIWNPAWQFEMGVATFILITLALFMASPERIGALLTPRSGPVFSLACTLVAFMLWLGIRAVGSDIPALSLAHLGAYLLPFIVAFVVATLNAPRVLDTLIRGLATMLFLLALLTVFSALFPHWAPPLNGAGRTQWPFEDSNHLAMMMNAGILMGFSFVHQPGTRRNRCVTLALIFVCLAALFTTGSRGGILGLVLGMVIFLFLARPRVHKKFLIASIGLIALVMILLTLLTGAGLMALTGFAPLLSNPAQVLGSRPEIWSATLSLFLLRPLAGFGTGTFSAIFGQVATPAHLTSGYAAHNDFLQIMAETGIVGGSLYVAILIFGIRTILKTRHMPMTLLSAPALSALMLQAQIEFMLGVLPVLIVTGIMLGMVMTAAQSSTTTKTPEQDSPARPLLRAAQLGVLLVFMALLSALCQMVAARALGRADAALGLRDVATFAKHLQTARAFSFDLQAGPYARAADYKLMLILNNGTFSGITPDEVQDQINEGLRRNPYLPPLYELQGRLDETNGKSPLPAWTRGLSIEPRSAALRLALLHYHEKLGHRDDIAALADDTRQWSRSALKGPVDALYQALGRYDKDPSNALSP